jgi:hypothetical protein
MARPITRSGQLLQRFPLGDGDEVPGLGIFGRLRPPSGIEDGYNCILGQGLVEIFAYRAFEAYGIRDVHAPSSSINFLTPSAKGPKSLMMVCQMMGKLTPKYSLYNFVFFRYSSKYQ